MKKVFCIAFLVFLLTINIGFSQEIPTLKKYVNDFADVLSASDEARINSLCSEIEKNWTVEIAVLTVDSTEPMSIEEYAVKAFEKNGIGKKDVDNGLLIVAAIQDRKWRFEVGYGLEPIINDAKAGRVGRNYLTPYFKEEKYGDGLYYAVDAVNKIIQSGGDDSFISEGIEPETIVPIIIAIIIFVFVLIPIFVSIFSIPKCPNCGTRMKCHRKEDYVICECPKCGKKVKKKEKKHLWVFFVGGFGGRGGGGGGGGFGGGGSGGGGASGGW